MTFDHPIRFAPHYQSRVWGGRRLQTVLGRTLPDATTPFGESWEVSDRAEAMSATPEGLTLNDLWQKHRAEVFGGLQSASPDLLVTRHADLRTALLGLASPA